MIDHSRRTTGGLALLAALLVCTGSAAAQEESVFRGDMTQGSWLRLHNYKGDVEVGPASSGQVEVRAVHDARDDEQVRFRVLRDGDDITICADAPKVRSCDHEGLRSRGSDRGDPEAHLVVLVPAGIRVKASTSNGDVRVEDTAAEVRAASGNGRVNVLRAGGPVTASSGNGAVRVEEVEGPVEASTGNGRVRVSAVRGPVEASSGNGDLEIRFRELPASPDDMSFSTGNGSIELYLPADFEGEVDMGTGNGSVDSDFPIQIRGRMSPHRLTGTIGEGGPRLKLSTGNGSLSLRRIGS